MPDVQSLITDIPVLSNAVVIEKLAGGPASDSWLVETDGKRQVVRIDTPRARKLGLDRNAELKVLKSVSAAAIGPEVIWANPNNGLLVTSYLPGDAWTAEQIHDSAHLARLARILRRLHALPASGPAFDPASASKRYARDIGTETGFELAAKAVDLAGQLLSAIRHQTLCHNDLVHSNIIGSDPVCLIDWEYAAIGDPLFDLATVVRHHELPAPIAREFLRSYFGSIDVKTRRRFDAFCNLYDLLTALWYMSVCGETDFDPRYTAELDKTLRRIRH
jgi:thiamine kinase